MAIDTTRTIEVRQSPWRIAGIILIGIGFVATSVFILPAHGIFGWVIGWTGVAFFGLLTLIAAWRMVTLLGPVVTISPMGVKDVRVAANLIPWSAIRNVTTWGAYNQPAIVLAVDPAYERTLKLTRMTRLTRRMNAAVGADGLCIASQGLKMGHSALFETITAYWQRAHGDRR
jgi:hypothetical protein